jgi:hypothetical protein
MNLFIDTNVFLSFYHLTSDDLEELNKLIVLLRGKEVKLWLPEQVRSETRRNRDNKIADALKRMKEQKLAPQFPQFCKDYPEYATLRQLQRDYEDHLKRLTNQITDDAIENRLKADGTIASLFMLAKTIPIDEAIIAAARLRCDLGNPPGKPGSLGDAINWEALLANVPADEPLYLVSDDKDYYSPLKDDRFNLFLLNEWNAAKKTPLTFYRRMSSFFSDHFPHIKLASELEKEVQIRNLAKSGSFARTHSVVAQLACRTDYTDSQIVEIVNAVLTNGQVYRIADDVDVKGFLTKLLNGREDKIDSSKLTLLKSYMNPPSGESSEEEVPF